MSEPDVATTTRSILSTARRHPVRTAFVGGLTAVALVVSVVVFTPLLDARLERPARGELTYDEARTAAAQLMAQDGPDVSPECRTRIDDPGSRVAKSVILLHGYTNCPAQFRLLADAYAAAGYAVVVPRLPQHGFADRLTDALSELTPEQLATTATAAADIAAGFADDVTVVGLSAGGTMAAWLAGHRDDVDEAVLLAPLIAPSILPIWMAAPAARVSRLTPDIHLWWDGELQASLATPPYAYPRYSIKSMGALLALGRDAQTRITRSVPLRRLLIVENPTDSAISNLAADDLRNAFAGFATTIEVESFPADSGFRHDLIDPQGENAADLPRIYGVLEGWLNLPGLAGRATSATWAPSTTGRQRFSVAVG